MIPLFPIEGQVAYPPIGTNNLTGWFAFQGNGTNLTQNKGYNLVLNGGVTFANGRLGNAASFNGSTQYASYLDNGNNFATTNSLTVSFWFKQTQTANESAPVLVGNNAGGLPRPWFIFLNYDYVGGSNLPGCVVFGHGPGSSVIGYCQAVGRVNDKLWHHLVVTRLTNTLQGVNIWIDGQKQATTLAGTTTATSGNLPINQYFQVGGWGTIGFAYFQGLISHVGVWNTNLPDSAIKFMYGFKPQGYPDQ